MLVGFRNVTFGRPPRVGDRLEASASFVQRFGDLVRVAGRVTGSGETLARRRDPPVARRRARE
jgi:acyl dehydratase